MADEDNNIGQDEESKKKKRSIEDINREIAETELETRKLLLGEAKERNAKFKDAEIKRKAANRQRMAELAELKRTHEATVRACRHKSGGNPKNILKGGGIGSFSIITRAIMPDGVTVLLQCPRCRMLIYTPSLAEKKENPEKYAKDLKIYNKLLEESQDSGLEHAELRGPTFMFQNKDGVPVIPERR